MRDGILTARRDRKVTAGRAAVIKLLQSTPTMRG